jgi:DNA-binding NtrC family response regulator
MTRVLVVHHDVDIADVEADGLRRMGYEVDQCAGPAGGGECPVMHGQRCWQVDWADVLVYDVWAAGDDGAELLEKIRSLYPDIPVVMTSGGLMLDWEETEGTHAVTPVNGPPNQVLLAAAVEAALRSTSSRPAPGTRGTSAATRDPVAAARTPRW